MMRTARRMCVIAAILAGHSTALAGEITGSVKDGTTGEPLIGAAVSVVNTKLGAVTDLDGRYVIAGVPAGLHSLRVMYAGYALKVVAGVAVTGNETSRMDLALESMSSGHGDAMRIEDIYVTAERVRTTSASILSERQRAAVIGDAISAEQIRLSPDGSSSDALKRVTGLSIVDDKYVFVRGVTDRYNSTTLNGVAVTGTDTDADKKSFNFDLMPASLIASTVVAKTATPDLPGDFSGGLVQVNTLDLPGDFLAVVNLETGYDSKSTDQRVRFAPGGGRDWAARDDGARAFPRGLSGVALAQALPNSWGTSGDDSRMNQSYALGVGDRVETGVGDFGFVASGTYKTNYKVDEYHQQPEDGGVPIFTYDGTRYRRRYLWGGLLNLNYQPRGNHTLSFENNYTRSAEDKANFAYGRPENGDSARVQTTEWDQRDLYLGQLRGDHTFPSLRKLEVDWRVSYSTSDAQEPDRKFAKYIIDPRGNYILRENYRTWSELGEETRGAQADFSYPIGVATFKTGYLYAKRERDYSIEAWVTDASKLSRENRILVIEPIDEIFAPENYGDGKFQFVPWSPFTGAYGGVQNLRAYYGMTDVPFRVGGLRFRLAGGARVEDSEQVVDSPVAADSDQIQTARIDERDFLPSANLTYAVTDRSNVRLGYFKSVNRPEFREMANVVYLDFDANQGVLGNPDLERAVIDNYDVRFEVFPGVGEVLAVSYFHKDMTDAIEEQLLPSPDRYVRTWFNSPSAVNRGFEVEVRKNLGFAWDGLANLVIQGNYTRVESEVEYTENFTDPQGNPVTETRTRTMQGQAPYTLNAGLVYSAPDIGLSASVLYNRFGRRLDAVGDTPNEDVFEETRDVIDFALTQQFAEWARLKFTIKDLTAEDVVYTFGTSGSVWEQVRVGTTYAVSLSFNL